jgi:hypothetical protein
MGGVVAPLAQNAMGGLGVAILGGLIGMGLTPDEPLLVWKTASIAGAAMFGLACMVRAFRDEVTILVSAYAAGQLDETTEALRRENKRLLDEVEYLKTQGMVAHQWGAREAAERLAGDYYVARATNVRDLDKVLSRAAAMERGMTRAEWEAGVQYLRNAGVLDSGPKGGVWNASSEEAALTAIARHAAVSRVRIRAANGNMAKL